MTPVAQRIAIAEGVIVGRLTIVRRTRANEKSGNWYWLCRCSCGIEKEIMGSDLSRQHTISCGCFRRETTATEKLIHGNARRKQHSSEYRSWCSLLNRTLNPKNPSYEDYGGRGITVCERWKNSFAYFLSDMGEKPSPQHSIERKNNNGSYEPSNCEWATPLQQANNRRKRRWKKKP